MLWHDRLLLKTRVEQHSVPEQEESLVVLSATAEGWQQVHDCVSFSSLVCALIIIVSGLLCDLLSQLVKVIEH